MLKICVFATDSSSSSSKFPVGYVVGTLVCIFWCAMIVLVIILVIMYQKRKRNVAATSPTPSAPSIQVQPETESHAAPLLGAENTQCMDAPYMRYRDDIVRLYTRMSSCDVYLLVVFVFPAETSSTATGQSSVWSPTTCQSGLDFIAYCVTIRATVYLARGVNPHAAR